jgi:hypothetical protein
LSEVGQLGPQGLYPISITLSSAVIARYVQPPDVNSLVDWPEENKPRADGQASTCSIARIILSTLLGPMSSSNPKNEIWNPIMTTTRIEVEAYGHEVNSAVLRLLSRQYPGVLVQGDSLQNLLSLVRDVEELLAEGNVTEAGELTGEVREILEGYDAAYRKALGSAK